LGGNPNRNRSKDTRTLPETQASRSPGGSRAGDDILERIVETKRMEIDRLAARSAELWDRARSEPPARDFDAALRRADVALIAEVKRRSPGAGDIRPELDPAELASRYRRGGAAAVSVLTDEPWFGGHLDDLRAVRARVDLPVLRKDFTLVPDQVAEARAAGADAVLLIVRILEPGTLHELLGVADDLGLAALVEAHDARELRTALDAGARILGINNRDLATFQSDLSTTLSLLAEIPEDIVVVSESGIHDGADVERLGAAGAQAVLVGESLLRADDPEEAARGLVARGRRARNPRLPG
jgi:indole-3-glycerol phosphate synthase